ncbi:MAG: hypothetical protein Q9201_004830 [Fulgogasparrea decipioides]
MDNAPHIAANDDGSRGRSPGSGDPHDAGSVAGKELVQVLQDRDTALDRVISRITSRSSYPDPGPPPDGGLQAWTQSLMGHLIVFNTWGYIISFGVFQSYYVTALGHPPSDISWVGSVQIFLLFFVGTFSGRATDFGLFRFTFITKRALAIGVAASGSATGGIVFPVIVQQLLPKIGFGWTVRVLGFVMLGLQALALAFVRPRLPPRKSGPLVEWAAFRELLYTLFAIGMFLVFFGLYFAIYYVGSFGRDIIGISQDDSINNLLILNGVGLFGRIIPAYFSDHYFGPLNTLIPFVFVSGLLLYCWAAVTSQGGLIGFAIVYGLYAAGIQSLFPATTSSLTTDLKKTGVRMGMIFSIVAFACLFGPPLAGKLIQDRHGSYLYAQMFAGTVMFCGCLTLIAARLAKTGKILVARV